MKARNPLVLFLCGTLLAPTLVAQFTPEMLLYRRTDGLAARDGSDDFTGALPDNTDQVAPFGTLDDPDSSLVPALDIDVEATPGAGISLTGDDYDLAFIFQFYDADGVYTFTENFDDRVKVVATPIASCTDPTATGASQEHSDAGWNQRTQAHFDFGGGGWFNAQIWLVEDGGGAQSADNIGFGYFNGNSDTVTDFGGIGYAATRDGGGSGVPAVFDQDPATQKSWGVFINSFDPNVDTDGDNIPDGYEELYFPGDLTQLGPGDFDNDGLNDPDEYINLTNPTKSDTDEDGLSDGEEITGSQNGSVPTDPLDPDSDDDSCLDGEETSGSKNTAFGNAPTDPNNADSDGDGFTDAFEISSGTDPNDANDQPGVPAPTATWTWDAFQDLNGNDLWEPVEAGAPAGTAWTFPAPASPNFGATNVPGAPAWYSAPSGTMNSFHEAPFNSPTQFTTRPVSWELVFRPGDFVGNHVLFETGGNGDGTAIVIEGDTIGYRAQDANNDTQRIAITHALSPGDEDRFHHVVATLQTGPGGANTATLYLNGTQVATGAATGNLNDWAGGDNSGLGRVTGGITTGQGGWDAFTGDIALLRFYGDKIVSAAEVQVLYASLTAGDVDSDGDGLIDAWENRFIGDLSQDGSDDGDGDGLDNDAEFTAGTDPTMSDTDGDGAEDGDELNGTLNPYTGGVLGAAPGDPTNPLNPDSDGDGAGDFAEMDGSNGSVTDPNNPDTDGDGFRDGQEIQFASDPTDSNSRPPLPVITSLGTGTAALIGGDLTDPENDGIEGPHPGAGNWDSLNWNWVSITASSEEYFGNNGGSEGAFDVFDNTVGPGQAKWCCGGPPQWITVEFAEPIALELFTITSGNDVPDRDPRVWSISGSLDGVDFTPIYEHDDPSASLWTQRLEVIEFRLPKPTPPYRFFKYEVTQTNNNNHQINEIEYFGSPKSERLFLDVDRSPADPSLLRLTWEARSGKVYDILTSADLTTPVESWSELAGAEDIPADPSGTNVLDIALPFPETGFVAVREENAPPLFFDDLESGAVDWTTVVNDAFGNTQWELGTPAGSTGPIAGAGGSANAFCTNLGDYGADSDISLRSPAIDLTAVTGAELSFEAFRDADGFADTAAVSFLRASDQTQLGAESAIDMAVFDTNYVTQTIPVPPEALGQIILVEFNFISDGSADSFSGLCIDDVSVSAN